MNDNDQEYDLVPTHLAVKAMRDNGYRNSAYAIAELIDNSIQAGATNVQLLCCEAEELVAQRIRRRIKHIAVLDDGSGMDAIVLRMALQFGNGTHLHDRSGIGRFGMGLPAASISQARRVDVWSWKDGFANCLHSFIDLYEVENGAMRSVPEPSIRQPPELWANAAVELNGRSGTLVVWSELDRCMWRTANTIISNSELVIGRMYRRFLHEGRVSIRMAAFTEPHAPGGALSFSQDEYARVNDPGYLLIPA